MTDLNRRAALATLAPVTVLDLRSAAERAGDEVAAVRLDREGRRECFTAARHERLGKRDHDFADVPAAGHEAESGIDPACGEGAERQRRERARLHEVGEFAEHLAGERFVAAEDGVHRDDVE